MKSAIVYASLGLVLFVSIGASAPPPPDIRPVRTVVAAASAEGEPISLTGHVRARTEENLAFRIDGRVISRKAVVGQVVQPGDIVPALYVAWFRISEPRPAEVAAAASRHHDPGGPMTLTRSSPGDSFSTAPNVRDQLKTPRTLP
ncbi:efflux RND transporter periplasmic adaptor subunit [Mesorhizobium sangaii]|uniref:Uncharacterized protein n=1 Tax=Mesorhizobium sangaii TaxID=505389 RepID=A0A841P264_9HYPH|nr:efflux RND transporter periplasmic adaptor subunit [Mesorhizobium sangaii]MBB6409246.1 hypothetical protein [Mesorhizobium sangaii]